MNSNSSCCRMSRLKSSSTDWMETNSMTADCGNTFPTKFCNNNAGYDSCTGRQIGQCRNSKSQHHETWQRGTRSNRGVSTVKTCPVWFREFCRISPPRFLAECRIRQLNQASFVLLYFCVVCFFWVVFSFCSASVLHLSTVTYFPACIDVNGTVHGVIVLMCC